MSTLTVKAVKDLLTGKEVSMSTLTVKAVKDLLNKVRKEVESEVRTFRDYPVKVHDGYDIMDNALKNMERTLEAQFGQEDDFPVNMHTVKSTILADLGKHKIPSWHKNDNNGDPIVESIDWPKEGLQICRQAEIHLLRLALEWPRNWNTYLGHLADQTGFSYDETSPIEEAETEYKAHVCSADHEARLKSLYLTLHGKAEPV